MKENKTVVPVAVEDQTPEFKGYTMEQIKYQRAMMALRKEFCKAKLMQSFAEIRPKKKESGRKSSKFSLVRTIASKVFSNLNTLDYVMMGISLIGTVRKGMKLIGKKK